MLRRGGNSGATGAAVRPVVGDIALWAALAGAALVWFVGHPEPSVALELVLPLAVLAVAIPARRRWPVAALCAVDALCAIGLVHPLTPANAYVLALAVFACLLGAGPTGTRAALLTLGGCLAFDLALCAALGVSVVWWYWTLTIVPLALLVPWLFGRYWQARLALVHGGWQRAGLLERRQGLVAEQARLRERTRIAADMHDSLGHELSLVALRAGALELSPTLTGQDRADLGELRAAVSDAVGHLRDTVGVLRDDGADRATAPTTESVGQLVDRARDSGVTVDLRQEGSPAPPGLSPLVERAVYRVVQESLTNAAKHAPGAAVRVRITHEAGHTRVTVTNTAPEQGRLTPPGSGGHGLAGLRERVEPVGGTLRAAPSGHGFEVVATLPDRPANTGRDPAPPAIRSRHANSPPPAAVRGCAWPPRSWSPADSPCSPSGPPPTPRSSWPPVYCAPPTSPTSGSAKAAPSSPTPSRHAGSRTSPTPSSPAPGPRERSASSTARTAASSTRWTSTASATTARAWSPRT
ncbi:histidine kinase [Streptomyces niveus]|uniref:sensor histidine kinase n=1 Tax=Streptomyces niveus TaxID=193462 RepID=UPI0036A7380D